MGDSLTKDAINVMKTLGYGEGDIYYALANTVITKEAFPECSDLVSGFIKVIGARDAGKEI